ncbi:hypothetical protein BTN49_1715 [Candidatus Enterovibrio escicola]|uniref:Mobile element protein n=1 Tax=Candidatus Enterovibrio escicola TaxID=1927127 RepID=A0A2A5T3M6_9GAMM|nr:hypothetical protein [Candidatus Enterovibrio escacola]PCS22751.1 hypothetical protein BTN49_1715 [Candidatus Enterovibrio escacola]
MNNLDAVFVDVDDFCQIFLPAWEKYLIFPVSNKEISLLISQLSK